MRRNVAVIDYGIGNVFSVCNALENVGAAANLTCNHREIMSSDCVILPGVGAFGKAMDALAKYGLDDTLRQFIETGRPFLGICIGMQLLMDSSSEFGENKGLGIIPGKVERIPALDCRGNPLNVPHISWVETVPAASCDPEAWSKTPLGGESKYRRTYYFVHSYHAVPSNRQNLIATINYGGNTITAAIMKNNVIGVQFHPEKSGAVGLQLLERFTTTR